MKTTLPKSLRSNWIVNNFFKPSKNKTRRGMTEFRSGLSAISKAESYDPRDIGLTPSGAVTHVRPTKAVRIANARRVKGGYKIVGILNPIPGDFKTVKSVLKEQGFTGIRMGAIKASF